MVRHISNNQNQSAFTRHLNAYGEHLAKQGRSHLVVLAYKNPNRQLIQFAAEKGVATPKEITPGLIREFQTHLYKNRDFAQSSVMTSVKHIVMFFDFLIQIGEIKENIIRGVEILLKPAIPETQLSHFYTYDEVLRRYLGDQEKWVSYAYLHNVEKHLKGFIKYLRANEIGSIYPVTESSILKYRDYLWDEFVHDREEALVVRSQIERLRCVVRLFRYLCKEGILKNDPATNLAWEEYYKDIFEKGKSLPDRPTFENNLTELDLLNKKFLEYQSAIGKDEKTLKLYKKGVEVFFEYLASKGIENVAQVNKRILLEYYTYLCNYMGIRGHVVSNGYKRQILWAMRLFFRFLVRFDYLAKDPSIDLENIKEERGLPHSCMNEKEVFELLKMPRLANDPLVLRDKAMMEILFSTGLRSNELCSLNIDDIDHKQEMVRVNAPKGGAGYQRIVPVGRVALEYLDNYLEEARPAIENGDPKALFLSYSGHRLQNEAVLNVVKKYAHQCGFRKNITTHSFRVTCATLMLKNGADIRYVQEQLGHKRITSTQIYTRLMPLDLKSIHRKCHPREKKAEVGVNGIR